MPAEPAPPIPFDLDVTIRNLERGQVIEVDVRGVWTEDELDRRLARLATVRQPAELRLDLDGGPHHHDHPPLLVRTRAALAAIGGRITVTFTQPPSEGPRPATVS